MGSGNTISLHLHLRPPPTPVSLRHMHTHGTLRAPDRVWARARVLGRTAAFISHEGGDSGSPQGPLWSSSHVTGRVRAATAHPDLRLTGSRGSTRLRGRPRTCLEKQRCWGTMLNWSQTDLGQPSLCPRPASIPGSHLASLGLGFPICEVGAFISTPEGGGQVKWNVHGKAPGNQKGEVFMQRGPSSPKEGRRRRSSLGAQSPGGAFGTPRCGAVLGAGYKDEKDLVSAQKEPQWRWVCSWQF